jgi:hypothetical protein
VKFNDKIKMLSRSTPRERSIALLTFNAIHRARGRLRERCFDRLMVADSVRSASS